MDIEKFRFDTSGDVSNDIREKYGFDGDILGIFAENVETVVHKWHHYLPIYDRYLSKYRGHPLRFLEIGVSKGGSLALWRKYFGPDAVIFGIDIDPACARFNGQAGQVRIGSQDDPAFLRGVIAEMGGVDVVLDDGSHVMDHIRSSLLNLFPVLSDGGTYMIEDLHTAYWPEFGGGVAEPRNFFNDMRKMVDDMHGWYHDMQPDQPTISDTLTGIHIHDSIMVLDKGKVFRPVHSAIGSDLP